MMNDFQVTWELVGFLAVAFGGFAFTGIGVLQLVNVILKGILSSPSFVKLFEGLANSVPAEEHARLVKYSESVDEKMEYFLETLLSLIVENVDLATDLTEEIFDGIPADQKPQ